MQYSDPSKFSKVPWGSRNFSVIFRKFAEVSNLIFGNLIEWTEWELNYFPRFIKKNSGFFRFSQSILNSRFFSIFSDFPVLWQPSQWHEPSDQLPRMYFFHIGLLHHEECTGHTSCINVLFCFAFHEIDFLSLKKVCM